MAAVFPPQSMSVLGRYAATDTTGYSVGADTDFTATDVTFTTTTLNTKWLVTISAVVKAPTGVGAELNFWLGCKVDGGAAITTDGGRTVITSYAGASDTRRTMTGRTVVTLATAASHTLRARGIISGGGTWTVGSVTLSAEQITT